MVVERGSPNTSASSLVAERGSLLGVVVLLGDRELDLRDGAVIGAGPGGSSGGSPCSMSILIDDIEDDSEREGREPVVAGTSGCGGRSSGA